MTGSADERFFFEIPIYRCEEAKHRAEMEKMKSDCLRPFANLSQEAYVRAERRFDEDVRYIWRYNEVVGWVHLSVRGPEIKGELYFVKSKRIRRGIRKQFHWAGEIFAIDTYPEDSSAAIYEKICAELERFRAEPRYRRWYLDCEAFSNIGLFVKWREMVDSD